MNLIETFNFNQIDDFDKHISLSIPNYNGLADIFRAIAVENVHPNGSFVDIGCSTGKFCASVPKISSASYTGVDSENLGVSKCGFDFHQGCAIEYLKSIDKADVISAMFTLQFMGKHDRANAISELVRLNKNGAVVLLAEKVYFDNSKLNQAVHREHVNAKRSAFTDKEILDKDYKLFGSMFCNTNKEMELELSAFDSVDSVWQSYNFKGWCIS